MKILITRHFFRQAKKLKNKFPHLRKDLIKKLKSFKSKNERHIGKSIYKIRINSRDINKGKSGGLRAFLYLYRKKNFLVPICIYSKSEKETITEKDLEFHFRRILEEIIEIFK